MTFNNNIIQNIVETNFMEIVYDQVSSDIWDLSGSDANGLFARDADLVELDELLGLRVDEYKTDALEDGTHVIGYMTVLAAVDGTSRYDGEDVSVGSANVIMRYHFHFMARDDSYDDFELVLLSIAIDR